jgi:hypothetical protein
LHFLHFLQLLQLLTFVEPAHARHTESKLHSALAAPSLTFGLKSTRLGNVKASFQWLSLLRFLHLAFSLHCADGACNSSPVVLPEIPPQLARAEQKQGYYDPKSIVKHSYK